MQYLDQLIGVGLKSKHYHDILTNQPKIGWLEVHSENYFYSYNNSYKNLAKISEIYPISIHGVGLSLGSINRPDLDHLARLKKLITNINPFVISEHLSWSIINGVYLPDLLPIPYTQEAAEIFINNINITQDYLGREILIENPSSYIEYNISDRLEAEFLVYVAKKSGAKILLDVNNIYVSCVNHNWNSNKFNKYKYIDLIPVGLVSEIHLAGHSVRNIDPDDAKKTVLVDTHNNYVCPEVWDLYNYAINKFGPKYTLLEWDQDIPDLNILIAEANKAKNHMIDFCGYGVSQIT